MDEGPFAAGRNEKWFRRRELAGWGNLKVLAGQARRLGKNTSVPRGRATMARVSGVM